MICQWNSIWNPENLSFLIKTKKPKQILLKLRSRLSLEGLGRARYFTLLHATSTLLHATSRYFTLLHATSNATSRYFTLLHATSILRFFAVFCGFLRFFGFVGSRFCYWFVICDANRIHIWITRFSVQDMFSIEIVCETIQYVQYATVR